MTHSSSCRLWLALAVLRTASSGDSPTVVCETTVNVGNGQIVIELFPEAAPKGVERLVEMVKDGFFTDLPFFRAIPNFLIQFGISPDAEKHKRWQARGNIKDDERGTTPFTDGIVSYAGYGKESRSTHLFLTLGNQPGLGRSPWEVPVGKVVQGLDVMKGIYSGYGDQVNQNRLQPTSPGAAAYLASFPKLDRFKSCEIRDAAPRVEL